MKELETYFPDKVLCNMSFSSSLFIVLAPDTEEAIVLSEGTKKTELK